MNTADLKVGGLTLSDICSRTTNTYTATTTDCVQHNHSVTGSSTAEIEITARSSKVTNGERSHGPLVPTP